MFRNISKISLNYLFPEDISNLKFLEFFGGEGVFQTDFFANQCKISEIWEIESEKCEKLKSKFPNSIVKCKNSLNFDIDIFDFDILSIDAPLCVFSNNTAEHFSILNSLLAAKKMTILINVVTNPFDYDKICNSEWRQIRKSFYGNENFDIEFAKQFYTNFFSDHFKQIKIVTHVKEYRKDIPYLHHMRIDIEK